MGHLLFRLDFCLDQVENCDSFYLLWRCAHQRRSTAELKPPSNSNRRQTQPPTSNREPPTAAAGPLLKHLASGHSYKRLSVTGRFSPVEMISTRRDSGVVSWPPKLFWEQKTGIQNTNWYLCHEFRYDDCSSHYNYNIDSPKTYFSASFSKY